MHRTFAFVSVFAAVGCAASPTMQGQFKSELDLTVLLPAGAEPVGVAVSPEGKRYVLDRRSGLYEITATTANPVFRTSDLATRYGLLANLDLTDVVALSSEQFAVTAENEGYLLDLHGGTFESYFCYLPSISPASSPTVPQTVSQRLRSQGVAVKERTESVAFAADGLALFAQPRTFRMDTGSVVGSELFGFSGSGGEPTQVITMPDVGFVAGGMVTDGVRLLMGSGHSLYEMIQPLTGQVAGPILVTDLSAPIEIQGLARERNGDLLVLDGAGRRLLVMDSPR